MTQSPVAAEVHEPLNVHGDLTTEITLDHIVAVDHLAQLQHFLVGQLRNPSCLGNRYLVHDFLGLSRTNAVDILQRDHDALVRWYIDASNTSHVRCSLCGLMRRASAQPSRYLSIRMSPEKATQRKKAHDCLPPRPGHRWTTSPIGYFRLIKGFSWLSSTQLAVSCTT